MGKAKKAKVTAPKGTEGPVPGKETREVFSAALDIARGLANSKGLRIDVDVSGDLVVNIDSEKFAEVPDDKFKAGLTRDSFERLLRTEFDSLLEAAMYDDAVTGVKARVPRSVVDEVGVEEFVWRVGKVEKALVPAGLRERVTLRKTTDAFVIEDLRWQVGVRKHDNARGKLQDIPYGCFSIAYDCARTSAGALRIVYGEDMAIELPVVREPKQITLELHEADVEELIETLTELRNKLKKLRKGK